MIDIAAVAELANSIGARLVVDNVFATPLQQKPLELGAHIVVYSATKHIDGQGRCLGGVILSDKKWIDKNLHDYFRHTGPSLSPFNAWTLLKGLETLPVRVRQQTESAGKIADFLAGQAARSRASSIPAAPTIRRPTSSQRQMSGGSTLICLDLKGGKKAAFAFQNALEVDPHLQQSRRRQEPDHPSGDHHAQEPDRRGARRTRHRAGNAAHLGRAGGRRRSDRGHRDRAQGGAVKRAVTASTIRDSAV